MAKETFAAAKRRGYTTIENEILDDPNVKLEGKGLIAILLSNTDDWEINMKNIISRSKNGRDAHYSTIWNLIEQGYYARIYIKESGKHRELVHCFSAVKEDVRLDVEERVQAALQEKGVIVEVEYLIKKGDPRKVFDGEGEDENGGSEPHPEIPEVDNSPYPGIPEVESPEARIPELENQYINKPNINKPNNNKPNINKDLNLDLDNTLRYIWEMKVPLPLKKFFANKVEDLVYRDTSFDLTAIEYFYNSSPEYIQPNCDMYELDYLNDFEFTDAMKKMYQEVERPIQNMEGLIKSWIQWKLHFKREDITESN